jgi:hypothetical protein
VFDSYRRAVEAVWDAMMDERAGCSNLFYL